MSRLISTLLAVALVAPAVAQSPSAPNVEYYRLVPGFLPEVFNDGGMATGTGFATPNPWGAYTAYLLATNATGQRTWRIENYLPNTASGTAQGSTMYLFEGNERALLVDTAQNTADAPGQPNLKAVVRHLLGHQNDGSVKGNPVDFVVANTHSHGDHTGKNSLMSDRTVYYPDLDWPRTNAPANYVPIKEGGGASEHAASGQAAGEIVLGGRTIVAIDIHEHTPGSTGYLDRENRMVATGDAIGSAYVWAHFGFITQYAASVHHLQDVLRPLDRVDVLPAHFYQIKQGARGKAPLNGRPLDKSYVDDQVRVADGILAGTVTSVPYRSVGRNTVIATVDSAQVVYSLGSLRGPGTPAPDPSTYHVVAIPGNSRPATPDVRFGAVDRIGRPFFLIRDTLGNSMYLLVGSAGALLVGSGTGTPGLASLVSRLAGSVSVSVVALSDDANQVGGLTQFAGNRIFLPKGMAVPAGLRNVQAVGAGDTISLGGADTPQPLALDVYPLAGHSANGITLIVRGSRALFSGDALGMQGGDAGLVLRTPLAAFADALKTWRASTDGQYDVLYTSRNYQWLTTPTYVDDLQKLVAVGIDGASPLVPSTTMPGAKMIRSAGNADAVASVVFP